MEYLIHIVIIFSIYGILALSLNLLVGYTGLLSLAHAAFLGIGAYTTAILTTNYHQNFFVSLVAGMVISGVIGWLLGLLLSKFKDDYFLLVSLGFMVITNSIFLNWHDLTHGALGITGIPRPKILPDTFSNGSFLLLSITCLLAIYSVCFLITHSSFGRVLKAIREDEKAIQIFGYNTRQYKLVIFVISAILASFAGSLFASYISYVDPTSFTIMESVLVLSMVILGGLASLRGSLLGAICIVILPEGLRFVGLPDEIAGQMRELIYGALLVIFMLYKPQGMIGEYKI